MIIGNRGTTEYWIDLNIRHDWYNRSLVKRIKNLRDPSIYRESEDAAKG